jgi:hypothetical protein
VLAVFMGLMGVVVKTYGPALALIYSGCVVQGLTGSYGVFFMVGGAVRPCIARHFTSDGLVLMMKMHPGEASNPSIFSLSILSLC